MEKPGRPSEWWHLLRPADDAMCNMIKGLLQTQATLCRFLY